MSKDKDKNEPIPPLEFVEHLQIQDCKSPAYIARQLSNTIMLAKANTGFFKLFILGFLAGVYVGFGGELAAMVTQDTYAILGSGLTRVIGGLLFNVALILIIIAGGELFTGNNLILLSVLERKTTFKLLFRNWIIVYFSNFVGTIFIVTLLYLTGLWTDINHGAAVYGLKIAVYKVNIPFFEAFIRGILANWLVCLAIWMSVASRLVIGKIMVILLPIIAFAATGYEHCIANMFFITKGLFLKNIPQVVAASGLQLDKLDHLTIKGFIFNNLIPVTLGNILGAIIFVVCLYWFVFLKDEPVIE